MFNDFSRAKLEIVVQKVGDLFQASCPLFPKSIGVGSSEKEAVEDLADLIAYRMEVVIKSTVLDNSTEIRPKQTETKSPKLHKKKIIINQKLISEPVKPERKQPRKAPKEKFTFTLPLKNDLLKAKGVDFNYSNRPAGSNFNSPPESYLVMGLPTMLTAAEADLKKIESLLEKVIGRHPGLKIEEIRIPEDVVLGIPVSFN